MSRRRDHEYALHRRAPVEDDFVRAIEYELNLEALRRRSPDAARRAMREHLTRVLDSLLAATEVHELEQARARIAAERKRYGALR